MKTDEIIEKAIGCLRPVNYEPPGVGYFVTMNGRDLGNEDFCENCIKAEVKRERRWHREQRRDIIARYDEVSKTGRWNGEKITTTPEEIKKLKRLALKEYPAKAKFDYEGHDPDFGGGNHYPLCCAGCGEYFFTDFYPDLNYAKILMEKYGDGHNVPESLKWELEIAFLNYRYLKRETRYMLLNLAKKIIKQ